MSSLLCNDCKQPVCGRKHAATCYGCENWQLPYCDKCLFPVDSKGQQGSVQEERAPSLNMETLNNGNRYSKYHPKSKSFPDDSDDMVINKCLPPRETEDTHFQDLSLKPTRLNGLPETPIPAVVGNLGINLREDVSYQSVSLPLDKEAPSFIPKTDWKKTQKLFKQPKDEFQSGSVAYGTEKALQELPERGVQLTTGTHGVLLKKMMETSGSLKSKSFSFDSGDMVNKKCLPPRETEDTDLYQDFQSLKFYPKVDPRPASLDGFADNGPPRPASLDGFADNGPPRPASLDGFADNGPLETPIAEAVGFGNLGIDVKPDVSYQSVFLPMDKETPSFIPKTDWGKTPKLSKKPKDEFQRQSVTYETDKAQQEMLECPIQLTTGTLKKEQSVHPAVETDCHQEMQPVPKLMMEHDPKQRYSAQEAHCYIEVQQKNEQRPCFKSVQATDHALKLKAKQQDVAKEKQVSTEEMFMQKSVPETAITILQADTGPVKNRKKLHDKITPYTKPPPALAVPMTPVQELNKLHQTKEQKIQTVTILDVSNQQPLSEDLQREMQPVFPTPALFEGEDIVDDIGDGLFESNHQILRQVTDDSSSSRAFDENEVPVNVPNIAFQ